MQDRIFVINPNSTVSVTQAIDDAMTPLRIPGGPEIACLTLDEGPPGVESQTDADGVIQPLWRMIRDLEADAAALSSPASATPACSRPARRRQSRCSASPNAGS
jgi:allantoin racemase